MKVFLDVGANNGQSLAAALDPEFGFDRIVCFEPAKACWPRLAALVTPRVRIECFGLWNRTCEMPMFQPGTQGAGLWKKDRGLVEGTEFGQFRRASDWMRENIAAGDVVYLKLNCEGAECDIVDDLLDSGEFAKVAFVMIDFDVRKIATQRHREAEVRARLAEFGAPRVLTSREAMRGETHQDRIKHWLRMCH